ncbi:hypothetical protein ACHAQH_007484 [Verticillium albo-atrum]
MNHVTIKQEDGDDADTCKVALLTLFPDMCSEYLEQKAAEWSYRTDDLVDYILGLPATGESYMKRLKANKLKRKLSEVEPPDQMALLMVKYDNPERYRIPKSSIYQQFSKKLISHDFSRARVNSIHHLLAEYGHCLFPAYLALAKIAAQWEDDGHDGRTAIKMKKTATVADYKTTAGQLNHTIENTVNAEVKEVYEELRAVRLVRASAISKKRATKDKEREEVENLARAKADGTVQDCGCCFDEYALNRMVYCDGPTQHLFCVDCARTNAENTVGQGKYEILCMSTEGCSSGFSHAQQKLFIDDSLRAGLDRVEYQVMLIMAGKTPFIKEFGCNKMTCTRPGCRNMQCYICSQSCDYKHFNDVSRGGKQGNCPLFDDQEKRHDDEVREAEEIARKKITEENPDVNAEYLKFNMSNKVAEDSILRKAKHAPYVPGIPAAPRVLPEQVAQPQHHILPPIRRLPLQMPDGPGVDFDGAAQLRLLAELIPARPNEPRDAAEFAIQRHQRYVQMQQRIAQVQQAQQQQALQQQQYVIMQRQPLMGDPFPAIPALPDRGLDMMPPGRRGPYQLQELPVHPFAAGALLGMENPEPEGFPVPNLLQAPAVQALDNRAPEAGVPEPEAVQPVNRKRIVLVPPRLRQP